MPASSRRPVPDDPDDPWGFGAADGLLVELRREAPPEAPAEPPPPPAAEPPQAPARRAAMERPRPVPPVVRAPAVVAPLEPPPAPPDLGELRPYLAAHAAPAPDPFAPRRRPRRFATALLAVGLVALSGVGAYVWFAGDDARLAAGATIPGTFVLSSQPPGAQVTVDGVPAGVTPLALPLPPGPHEVVATAVNGRSERLNAEVTPGESAARHLVLEPLPAALPAPGTTPVPSSTSTPAGATSPGQVAAPAPPAPSFVTFSLPFDVQIYENGTFLGSNSGERLRVRPGAHTFTLVNEQLGFRTDETVVVGPGRSTRRVIEQRSAPLSVNALPWAEVFISGRSFGETPLANISLPIGTYRVTLRHPTLGEREVPVTVRLGAPNRVAVDLRR